VGLCLKDTMTIDFAMLSAKHIIVSMLLARLQAAIEELRTRDPEHTYTIRPVDMDKAEVDLWW